VCFRRERSFFFLFWRRVKCGFLTTFLAYILRRTEAAPLIKGVGLMGGGGGGRMEKGGIRGIFLDLCTG
jgi:hypothetical protein